MHYTVKEKTDINNYSAYLLSVNRVMKMALGRKDENTKAGQSPFPLPYMVVPAPMSQYEKLQHRHFRVERKAKFLGWQSFDIPAHR